MPRTDHDVGERRRVDRTTADRISDLALSIFRADRQAAAVVLGIVADALHESTGADHRRTFEDEAQAHATRSRQRRSLDRALDRVIDTVDDIADHLTSRAKERRRATPASAVEPASGPKT